MLKYFYENDLVQICEKTPANWEEAIAFSCQPLLDKKLITAQYIEEIITCVKQYGPYIVIVPKVALPHSSENSNHVLGTAIAFTKMKQEVVFEENNSEKNAQLFFTLAAKKKEEHMANISKLSEMLLTDGLIEALLKIETTADYEQVMKRFDR